jgi:hypothetical protein
LIVGALVSALLRFIAHTAPENQASDVTDNSPTASNVIPASSPSRATDKVIRVDVASLLTAFEVDEKAAAAQYENRKAAVTGPLSGAFIPPVSVSMNMAAKGLADDAFVTMAGPPPSSVEDTLFVPGINAYSENASLF